MENLEKSKKNEWLDFDFFPVRVVLFCLHYAAALFAFAGLLGIFVGIVLLCDEGHPLAVPCVCGGVGLLVSFVLFMGIELLCRSAAKYLEDSKNEK